MSEKLLSDLTDEQLLTEAKELKSFSIINAALIGFLLGIIFVTIYYSAYTVAFLIPLYLVYKFVNDPRNKKAKEINELLKQRNLQA